MARAAAKSARSGRRRAKAERQDEGPILVAAGSEIFGLVLIGLSLLATLALATYSAEDPVAVLVEVRNAAGPVGATLAGGLLGALGAGAVVLVAACAFLGGRMLMSLGLPGLFSRFWIGALLLIPSVAALPPLLFNVAPETMPWIEPGWLGAKLARYETLLFGTAGALVLSLLLFAVGALSLTGISSGAVLERLGRVLGFVGRSGAAAALWLTSRAVALSQAVGARSVELSREGLTALGASLERGRTLIASVVVWRERRARRSRVQERREPELSFEVEQEEEEAPSGPAAAMAVAPEEEKPVPARRGRGREEPDIVDHVEERRRARKPEQEAFRFNDASHSGPFELPDISVFAAPPEGTRSYDRDSLLMNSKILEKKLADFGVNGRVVRVHPGPVITMYEYEPAAGIKVGRIVGLTDDLTMALRAISIRIIAPLPGKSVVGIEVPNPQRETVYLREILESPSFRKSKSPLAVAMGKDIFGNSVTSDLARMPHLLVAGSTGTGKSVFLNSFLCSLLCRATPHELKLLLVDPKMLELSIYDGIPHLIADVVTSPKRASAALQGVVRKMEERYQMMSATQVRNIDQFNEKARKAIEEGEESFQLRPKPGETEGEEVEWQELPYIVVVIDELADLMLCAAKEVEESLQRLAQMARASGIHLVLATQRPSVDVLTGVIKANFPARVSFQVSSGTDSRTILDQKGADNLLGMGDMLFLPPGTAVLQRIHGPFVTETEVVDLVKSLKEQGRPVFDEDLVRADADGVRVDSSGEEVDEMFDQAVAIVAETRNASISYVQRRLKIGYNRAARIVEQMENDGMVGPQIGSKGREVFLPPPGGEDE
ncbi:MAG: DNA translocase FtsK 4TM domain-containing protein [Deltaproteobacteria bacterium]|jgi:S-DNA-T family DNA segregation ATPase FtsK/SpoIIIE|nr:DNA translocase FtsK 4TM domain-containing protein [Deltaproteobacteria bacterium]